jgi:hypothetical protein
MKDRVITKEESEKIFNTPMKSKGLTAKFRSLEIEETMSIYDNVAKVQNRAYQTAKQIGIKIRTKIMDDVLYIQRLG